MYEKDETRDAGPAEPDKPPWLARDDWREMRVRASGGVIGCWVLAAVPAAFAAAVIAFTYTSDVPLAARVIAWIVALPGAAALLIAVQVTMGRVKVGLLELELDELPIVPGREVAATIVTGKPVEVELVKAGLKCRRSPAKSGDRRKIHSEWQTVDPADAVTEDGRTRIPVTIRVPADLPPVNDPEAMGVRWKLGVHLRTSRGATYASFALPVFKAGDSEIQKRKP